VEPNLDLLSSFVSKYNYIVPFVFLFNGGVLDLVLPLSTRKKIGSIEFVLLPLTS
jgi:hypothetical protein